MNAAASRRLTIPVTFVDGAWECSLGGGVPVKPGTEGDLSVNRLDIVDKNFLKTMELKGRHKVLDEGTSLLVCLTIKPSHWPSEALAPFLLPYSAFRAAIDTAYMTPFTLETLCFVKVYVDKADEKQWRKLGSERGGLWLLTQGIEAKGLDTTTISLPQPVSSKPVRSLNHAFTKLSEAYEPWRISHTGNIYTRVLYQEKNERWYPLDLLRNKALDKQGQEIASTLWKEFMARMTTTANPPKRQ